MDHDEFSRKVIDLRERIEKKLERRSTAGSGPNREEAVEELRACLEELRVGEEELRRQNEELIVARQRYQEFFDFAPDAYLVTDPSGIIQEANRAAAKLFQLSMEFIVGKPMLQFLAKEEHEGFLTQVTRLRVGNMEKVENWEIKVRPRTGESPLRASMTVGVVRDGLSRPAGLRWLIRVIAPPITGRPQNV